MISYTPYDSAWIAVREQSKGRFDGALYYFMRALVITHGPYAVRRIATSDNLLDDDREWLESQITQVMQKASARAVRSAFQDLYTDGRIRCARACNLAQVTYIHSTTHARRATMLCLLSRIGGNRDVALIIARLVWQSRSDPIIWRRITNDMLQKGNTDCACEYVARQCNRCLRVRNVYVPDYECREHDHNDLHIRHCDSWCQFCHP